MVKGQLEALGTPQHLKQKFGSGYELSLRLRASGGAAPDDPRRVEALTAFVVGVFPDAVLVSANGGLLTYRVPKESVHVGTAFAGARPKRERLPRAFLCHRLYLLTSIPPFFAALEDHHEELGLSDYSVSQPTLEQGSVVSSCLSTSNWCRCISPAKLLVYRVYTVFVRTVLSLAETKQGKFSSTPPLATFPPFLLTYF